jgi:hypothetical protein
MTLYQFNDLDELEQHEAICEHGIMIGDRIEGENKIVLYQLFSFYVELFHHIEYNVLRKLRSFSSTEQLDAYISMFDLKELKDTLP